MGGRGRAGEGKVDDCGGVRKDFRNVGNSGELFQEVKIMSRS